MTATLPQISYDAVLDVRPGDHDAATRVERWLHEQFPSAGDVVALAGQSS